jgi:hypothetical protein
MSLSRLLFLFFVLASFCKYPAAHAADVEFPSPDTAVSADSTTTYLDLARHFVPDIKGTDNGYVGTSLSAIRHIGGENFNSDKTDTYGFYDLAALRFQKDDKARLLVLFDLAQATQANAQGVAVLALYDVGGKAPKLLDAADVGFDQGTYFFEIGRAHV